MKKTKPRDVLIALTVCLTGLLFWLALIADHLHKQDLMVEHDAVRMVYYACEDYVADRYANGETVTAVTCKELADNGYISDKAGTLDFEIKITLENGTPKVEYVKSEDYRYP